MSCNAKLRVLRLGLYIRRFPSPAYDPAISECTWFHHLLSTVTSKELAIIQFWVHLRGLCATMPTDASRLLAMLAAFFSAPVCTDVDVLLSGKQFAAVGTVQIGVLCDNHGLVVDGERWGALLAERFPLLDKRGILR